MKIRRIVSLFLLVFALVASACSDDTTNDVVIGPTPGNDSGSEAPDTGSDDAGQPDVGTADTGTTDTGQADAGPIISVPGFLHGTWLVKEDDTTIATLDLSHEQGQTMLTGAFEMVVPAQASGTLSGTTWRDDSFTTSWFAEVNGSDRQFGVSQATKSDDDTLSDARFLDGTTGGFRDVTLLRQ